MLEDLQGLGPVWAPWGESRAAEGCPCSSSAAPERFGYRDLFAEEQVNLQGERHHIQRPHNHLWVLLYVAEATLRPHWLHLKHQL